MDYVTNHRLGPDSDISRDGHEFPTAMHGKPPTDDQPASVCLADVQTEEIDWLWPDRIAVGKLTIIAGDPGVGKSTATLDIAAIVTQGCPWPDTPNIAAERGSVILLSAEDGLADTIKPRLEAAGADTRRVFAMTTIRRRDGSLDTFNLGRDLARLEDEIERIGDVRLVIIDPISAFISGTDDHKNSELRGLLAPIKEMAERLRVAVILVTHLNKNIGGKAPYRVMGSLAYVAAVRAAFLVCEDPNIAGRRLMLRIKSNISAKTSGLAFRIVNGAVVWEEKPVTINADQLLAQEQQIKRPESRSDKAGAFLVKLLSSGPKTAKQVWEAGEAEGFQRSTLDRAAGRVGIARERFGFGKEGYWLWSLPEAPAAEAEHPEPEEPISYATYGEPEVVA